MPKTVRFAMLVLAMLAPALSAGGARADFSDDRQLCNAADTAPATAIEACARNLESGFFEPVNLAVVHYNRGNAYLRQGNLSRAKADYDAAIRLDPDNPAPYNNRGYVHAKEGRFTQAVADFSKALLLKPGYAQAFVGRGAAYRKAASIETSVIDDNQISTPTDAGIVALSTAAGPTVPAAAPVAPVTPAPELGALEDVRAEIGEKASEITSLQAELTLKDDQLTQVQRQVAEQTQQMAALSTKLTTADETLAQVKAQLAQRDAVVADLTRRVQESDVALREMQTQITAKDGALAAVQAKLGEAEKQLGGMDNKVTTRQGEIDVLTARLVETEQALAAANDRLNDARTRIDDQGETHSALFRKFSKTQRETRKTEYTIQRLSKEVETLELHRMVLAGVAGLTMILALVGFRRRRR